MTDSIIMERVADAAADCLYGELVKTEDFEAFEQIAAADMHSVAAMALRKCLERFDGDLRDNAPRGWSAHDQKARAWERPSPARWPSRGLAAARLRRAWMVAPSNRRKHRPAGQLGVLSSSRQ